MLYPLGCRCSCEVGQRWDGWLSSTDIDHNQSLQPIHSNWLVTLAWATQHPVESHFVSSSRKFVGLKKKSFNHLMILISHHLHLCMSPFKLISFSHLSPSVILYHASRCSSALPPLPPCMSVSLCQWCWWLCR